MFRQDDLKRRFAYSSVENVGVIALCLGIGGPLGIAACLLHCVFHGFTKTLAFCVSGNIQHAFGTRVPGQDPGRRRGCSRNRRARHPGAARACRLPALRHVHLRVPHLCRRCYQSGPMWLVVVVALGLTVAISALTRIALKSVFGNAPQGMEQA
ncbi:MAG: proton-conducting transporter membrane subunit [Collinsella sp.]